MQKGVYRLVERFLLNLYIFSILVSLVFPEHEQAFRIFILVWLVSIAVAAVRARRRGARLTKTFAIYMAYFSPAFVSACVAICAKLMGTYNEWANGVLEIWIHPFFPVLELAPAKEVWNMSSTFALSCLIPLIAILIPYGVYLLVKPQKQPLKDKKRALYAP